MALASIDLALGGAVIGSVGAVVLAQTSTGGAAASGWDLIGQGAATFAGALGAVVTMHKILFQPALEREQAQSGQLIAAVQAALLKLTEASTEMASAHTRQAIALERLGARMDDLEREVFRMSPSLPNREPRSPTG